MILFAPGSYMYFGKVCEVCHWGNYPLQVSQYGYDKATVDRVMKKMATRAGGNLLRYVAGGTRHQVPGQNYWAVMHVYSVIPASWVGQHVLA